MQSLFLIMKSFTDKMQQIDDSLIIKKYDLNDYSIYKKKGARGNFILEWRNNTKKEEDCPCLELKIKNNIIHIINWIWTPGPGPGEFYIEFNNEQDALDFIRMYYFEENDLFNARIEHENNIRLSYNLNEIHKILHKLLKQLTEGDLNSEIPINERGLYYKIPFENWSMKKCEDEEPIIKVKTGYIFRDLRILREKLKKNEEYDLNDIEAISNLFLDLCNYLKKKS